MINSGSLYEALTSKTNVRLKVTSTNKTVYLVHNKYENKILEQLKQNSIPYKPYNYIINYFKYYIVHILVIVVLAFTLFKYNSRIYEIMNKRAK